MRNLHASKRRQRGYRPRGRNEILQYGAGLAQFCSRSFAHFGLDMAIETRGPAAATAAQKTAVDGARRHQRLSHAERRDPVA